MSRWIGVIAALAAAALVVGCQPSSPPPVGPTSAPPPPPSSTPTPTFMCTPEAGGAKSECTKAQYDEMKAKEALYAEAEEVFRTYFAENVRISRAGGVEEPTEVMLRTTHGAFLEDTLGLFQGLKRKNLHAEGEDPVIIKATRLPGVSKAGSIIAVRFCVDATGWAFYEDDKLVIPGIVAQDDTHFARVDGTLRIIGADGKDVSKCA